MIQTRFDSSHDANRKARPGVTFKTSPKPRRGVELQVSAAAGHRPIQLPPKHSTLEKIFHPNFLSSNRPQEATRSRPPCRSVDCVPAGSALGKSRQLKP